MNPAKRRAHPAATSLLLTLSLTVLLAGLGVTGLGGTAALAAEAPGLAPQGEATSCLFSELHPKPWWSYSASWSGDRLLIGDAGRREVMAYSKSGQLVPSELEFVAKTTPGYAPVAAQSSAGTTDGEESVEYLKMLPDRFLKVVDGRAVDDFSVKEWAVQPPLSFQGSYETGQIDRPHLWAQIGDDLVIFADVGFPARRGGDLEWLAGFLRIPAKTPPEDAAPLPFLTGTDAEGPDDWTWQTRERLHIWSRMAFPTIAGVGTTAYVLVMEDTPALYKNEAGSSSLERVELVDLTLDGPPDVHYALGFLDELPNMMERVESASVVVGMYAWEGDLYLLQREPTGTWRTRWSLVRLDLDVSDEGQATARKAAVMPLPTVANHLIVAPGDPWWAVVEKGPYLAGDRQHIPSAVFIPSRAVRGQGSLCGDLDLPEGLGELRRLAGLAP